MIHYFIMTSLPSLVRAVQDEGRHVVIRVSGEVEVFDRKPDLATLQKLVGGNIQAVPLWQNVVFVCDEEGRLKNYKLNSLATLLCTAPVFGDVVFTLLE